MTADLKKTGDRFMGRAAPTLWLMSGFLSWALYTYIFAGLFYPVVHIVISFFKPSSGSQLLITLLAVLLPHMPEYLLSFAFCCLLGLFFKVAKFRILAFITGANAVSFYYHLLQVYGYYTYYNDLHSGAPLMMGLGLVSTVVISPGFAFMGAIAGNKKNS